MPVYTYQHNGQPYTVHLDRQADGLYRATVSGPSGEQSYTFSAQQMNDSGWLLNLDGRRTAAYTASQGDQRFAHVDGQDYTLAVAQTGGGRRKAASGGGGDLTAQMPGQVREVLVAEGDTVQRGQTLVILEAMKMEIRVAAPGDGQVRRLLVRQGDVVERGQRLVEIEAKA
jgi:biotin carboxyl carrier protein